MLLPRYCIYQSWKKATVKDKKQCKRLKTTTETQTTLFGNFQGSFILEEPILFSVFWLLFICWKNLELLYDLLHVYIVMLTNPLFYCLLRNDILLYSCFFLEASFKSLVVSVPWWSVSPGGQCPPEAYFLYLTYPCDHNFQFRGLSWVALLSSLCSGQQTPSWATAGLFSSLCISELPGTEWVLSEQLLLLFLLFFVFGFFVHSYDCALFWETKEVK